MTPNHVHAIIVLSVGAGPRACPNQSGQSRDGKGQPQGVAPTNHEPEGGGRTMSLADVVHRFKTLTTKRYTDGVKQHGWPAFPGRLWQRNYYEHIIRNEASLDRIRLYVMNNPASWTRDRENSEAECYGRQEGQW
jgi:putative transposase